MQRSSEGVNTELTLVKCLTSRPWVLNGANRFPYLGQTREQSIWRYRLTWLAPRLTFFFKYKFFFSENQMNFIFYSHSSISISLFLFPKSWGNPNSQGLVLGFSNSGSQKKPIKFGECHLDRKNFIWLACPVSLLGTEGKILYNLNRRGIWSMESEKFLNWAQWDTPKEEPITESGGVLWVWGKGTYGYVATNIYQ